MGIILGLENLVDFANQENNEMSFNEDIHAKEAQTNITIQDCENNLQNVANARVKVNANLKMSKNLLNTMQNLEHRRKNQNMFVFGPNPIFSSAKENELNYSITNQFVIEMLKELDISFLVAEKNLVSAKECQKRYKENKLQIEESLQLVQETIEMQINKVNEMQIQGETQKTETPTQKITCESKMSEEILSPQKTEI